MWEWEVQMCKLEPWILVGSLQFIRRVTGGDLSVRSDQGKTSVLQSIGTDLRAKNARLTVQTIMRNNEAIEPFVCVKMGVKGQTSR